jgi:hypothetical protein
MEVRLSSSANKGSHTFLVDLQIDNEIRQEPHSGLKHKVTTFEKRMFEGLLLNPSLPSSYAYGGYRREHGRPIG